MLFCIYILKRLFLSSIEILRFAQNDKCDVVTLSDAKGLNMSVLDLLVFEL